MNDMSPYRNTAFWSWNGDMNEQEVRRQAEDFADKGYGGFFLHARGGLAIPYLREEGFRAAEVCLEVAARRGLEVWLYDEDGWPSGFGGGAVNGLGEEYCIKRLVRCSSLEETEGKHILAAYRAQGDGYVRTDGQEADLWICYVYDGYYVDLLDPRTVAKFIESTHEVYYRRFSAHFGSVIKGIFTDEPQVYAAYPWSQALPEAFRKLCGYDLIDNLWRFFEEKESAFRNDFYRTLAAQFTESFTVQLADWCRAHSIALTGHLAGEDGFTVSYRMSGGVMRNYEYMQIPGIDFLGRRLTSPVLPKQLGSVKNQLGKELAISETFGCAGWNTSFAQLLWIWGYQASFGLNKACLHLSAYTILGRRKRDYPMFYSYQEPWWEIFGAVNARMEEYSRFVSIGTPFVRVLVLSPLTSCYGLDYESPALKQISGSVRILLENLMALQIDCDLGDESLLSEYGSVEGASLRVGRMKYDCVLLPDLINLGADTLALLREFRRAGGKLASVGQLPRTVDWQDDESLDALTEAIPVLVNRRGVLKKYFERLPGCRRALFTDRLDGEPAGNLSVRVCEDGRRLRIFAVNLDTAATLVGRLHIEGEGCLSRIEDGRERILPAACADGETLCDLELAPMESVMLVLDPDRSEHPDERVLCESYALPFENARLLEKNALTVLNAACSLDGEPYGQETYLVHLQDEVIREVAERGRRCRADIRYRFSCECEVADAELVVETLRCRKIVFNGADISARFGESWYVDRCMKRAAVGDLLRKGENQLILTYEIAPERAFHEVEEVYETERNRYQTEVELESVYVLGTFDVCTDGVKNHLKFLETPDSFRIAPATPKNFHGDLTAQNLFFFRGGFACGLKIERKGEERVTLAFERLTAPCARIRTALGERAVLNGMCECDITDLLQEGENLCELTVYTSNRNLLGPHHHRSGEPQFVGPHTYMGVKGFEDSIKYEHYPESTFRKGCCFVPFGLDDVFVRKYRKRS